MPYKSGLLLNDKAEPEIVFPQEFQCPSNRAYF